MGESKRVEGGGSIESLLVGAVESVADHRFAADPHQERLVEKRGDFVQMIKKGIILFQSLSEAEARVENHILHPLAIERVERAGKMLDEVAEEVVVVGVELHLAGEAAGVSKYVGHIEIGDSVPKRRIELTTTDIVDDISACLDSFASGERESGVGGDDCLWQLIANQRDSPSESGSLLVLVEHLSSGASRDGSDIDDVAPLIDDFVGAEEYIVGVEVAPPVVERIGGDIENPHHRRAVEREDFFAAMHAIC